MESLLQPANLKDYPQVTDLTGKRFGRLTVIEFAGSDGDSWWTVRCDCGAEKSVRGRSLTKTARPVRSCGCLRDGVQNRTHGKSDLPIYAVWRSMVDRCRLPTHRAYPRYGGRGITVCSEWADFEVFYRDMIDTYRPGLTLERRDNNQGYDPQNCVWATYQAQARNRRGNLMVETPVGPMLLCDAATISGIGVTTLSYRVQRGWPAERMFDRPDFTNRL